MRGKLGRASEPAGGRAGQPTQEAIRRLVDGFYGRARRDALLGPVFARAVGESDEAWAAHLVRIADFWSSLVLRSGRYQGDPFSAHLRLLPGLEPAMFDRWLALFNETCGELFEPDVARLFQERQTHREQPAHGPRRGGSGRKPVRDGTVPVAPLTFVGAGHPARG